jgi:hypothetical protein
MLTPVSGENSHAQSDADSYLVASLDLTQSPTREIIFCLGMSWSHPTDRARLSQLETPCKRIVSVSSQINVSGNHVDCNFKTDRGITSVLRYLHAAMREESFSAVTVILDYFFLEKNYYRSNYGLEWLSTVGFRLLSQGVTHLILPNDNGLDNCHGVGMRHMLQATVHPALTVAFVDATSNPLWVASNHDSVTTECAFGKIRRLDNQAATFRYLDKDFPFVSLTLSSPPTEKFQST